MMRDDLFLRLRRLTGFVPVVLLTVVLAILMQRPVESCDDIDLSSDGYVGLNDFLCFVQHWGRVGCDEPADFAGDCAVGLDDYLLLVSCYGSGDASGRNWDLPCGEVGGDNAHVILTASVGAVKPDTPSEVTLQVSLQGAMNVSGIAVIVEYDPSAVHVVDGQLGAFLQGANLPAPLDTAKTGTVGVGGAIVVANAATAPDGDGVLATIVFSVTLAAGEETALTVSAVELLGVPASRSDILTPEGLVAVVRTDGSPPGVPSLLEASADETYPTDVHLTWIPPQRDSNGGSLTGLAGYQVYRFLEPVSPDTVIVIQDSSTSSYTDTGLEEFTTYYYTILAYDSVGNESPMSSMVSVRTAGVSVPTGLRVVAYVNGIELQWNKNPEPELAGYIVYRSDSTTGSFDEIARVGAEQYTDWNVARGKTYYYRIAAANVNGIESEYSQYVAVTVPGTAIATYYVSPAGDDVTGNGSESSPWRTISHAIGEASPGDTIKVMDDDDEDTDDYTENIAVNKSLTIERSDTTGANPQVAASDTSNHVFYVTADSVTIKGLDIHGAMEESNRAGICLDQVSSCTIQNNRCGWDSEHKNNHGICLYSSSDNTVSDNTCNSNDTGIVLVFSSNNNTVSDNTCNSNDTGIVLEFSSNSNAITGNTCSNNKIGIWMLNYSSSNDIILNICHSNSFNGILIYRWSNSNVVSGNACNSNGAGIYLSSSSNHNAILSNTCTSSTSSNSFSIVLDASSNNTVSSNTCSNSEYGISLWFSSSNNTVSDNTCLDSNYGIYLNSSSDNTIYMNNFVNSTTSVNSETSTNIWHSPTRLAYFYGSPPQTYKSYMGNYYSDYTGSDSNGDGIGDTDLPYVTDGGGDSYPLVQTTDNYALLPIVSLLDREGVPLNRSHRVPISVNDITRKGFTSLQTVLTYDGAIIRPLGVLTDGTMTEGWTVDFNVVPGTSPGTLKIAMATAQDTLKGIGTLFFINVEAAEGASVGDSTTLHFESLRFNEDTTEVDTHDGVVYIVEPVRLPGDVTGNGVVTAYDAAHILQHTVGLLALTGDDSVAAEVSGNDTISAYDASLVLQYVIDRISQFPVEDGGAAKVAYATRTVRLGELQALPDGRMCLPILIDEMDGVVAGEMSLSFPGDAGDVTISTSELTSGYLLASNVQDGRIRTSFAGAQSSVGPGPVLEIVFDESDAELLSSLRLERVSLNEGSIPVRITERAAETPKAYRLSQNYPNPFNPQTTISYDVAKTGAVRLSVYALTGQLVRTLVDGECPAGRYSVMWDGTDDVGRDVASGVYLCRMEAGQYSAVRKLVLVR